MDTYPAVFWPAGGRQEDQEGAGKPGPREAQRQQKSLPWPGEEKVC